MAGAIWGNCPFLLSSMFNAVFFMIDIGAVEIRGGFNKFCA